MDNKLVKMSNEDKKIITYSVDEFIGLKFEHQKI